MLQTRLAPFTRALSKCYSVLPKSDFHGAGGSVISAVRGGKITEAVGIYFKSPDPAGAASLIPKLDNVESLTKIYSALQTTSFVNQRVLTALVLAYRKLGRPDKSVDLLQDITKHAIEPDKILFRSIVAACIDCMDISSLRLLAFSVKWPTMEHRDINNTCVQFIQGFSVLRDFEAVLAVYQTLLKSGGVPNLSTFGALANSLFKNNQSQHLVNLWNDIEGSKIFLDQAFIVTMITACADTSALHTGRKLQQYVVGHNMLDTNIGTALINMYGKCGEVDDALFIFGKLQIVDITAYTAVIQALGVNGQGKKALDIFCQIDKTLLDQVVFSCILNACSHSFLVEEARSLLESMQEYDIQPTAVHYTCYADALGRAGYLEKAESIINKYASNDIVAWRALLGACRVRNNVEMAKRVSQKIFKLNPNDASSYVLLSNIFAANEQWEHVDQVRDVMKTRGVKKTPGVSHIEIDGKVHTFYVADTGHSTEVEAVLVQLFEKLKSEGFVHDLSSSLHNGNVEEKIQHLCRHSEKLALGFGLINTPPGTKIRITKNLRMCRDCHNAIRFISKIENRAIVVRDANRFHHFENGKCSCNDKF